MGVEIDQLGSILCRTYTCHTQHVPNLVEYAPNIRGFIFTVNILKLSTIGPSAKRHLNGVKWRFDGGPMVARLRVLAGFFVLFV